MIQCTNQGEFFTLVKCEKIFSDFTDTIIDKCNYFVRKRHKDITVDILKDLASIDFPDVLRPEIPYDKLCERIFKVKDGYPIEFKNHNIDNIKKEAFFLREELGRQYFRYLNGHNGGYSKALQKYCKFLENLNTTDCVILSLKNLRTTSNDYTKQNYFDIITQISNITNKYQTECMCKNICCDFIKREECIIHDYKKHSASKILMEYMYALTDKLSFFLNFAPHKEKHLIGSWKENIRTLSHYTIGENFALINKIENVKNEQTAKDVIMILSTVLRKDHIPMNPDNIAYDFDNTIHLGSDNQSVTLSSLIPNMTILNKIEAEMESKKIYIITHNENLHQNGFIMKYLLKWLGDKAHKIDIISTSSYKSEQILKYGISSYFDDDSCVLDEIAQYTKNIKCYNNLNLFLVNHNEFCLYDKKPENVTWFESKDDRICVQGKWYMDEFTQSNAHNTCRGCDFQSKEYESHTFDEYCKVTCKFCIFKINKGHSTYTRLKCLPSTRRSYNNTKLPDWAYGIIIGKLDENCATYSIEGDDFIIYGNCSSYIAKMILCTSCYAKVKIVHGKNTHVYVSNALSKSFSNVVTKTTLDKAISNCKIRKA